ncbi:hypothetical protein EZH22_07210 [Xanthobacter dioxanivorans]|uniref:Uncharacterized protein n=1 Tax=Xanthobacter dioxanivorans TaxID=2528964 RepID=A0A974PR22_9HYPH|nr:hypothetical protein [Xanthobacter dioxanivorans]QRG08115.1 hypothetical protein EZH22_07210 [Xanthobacter dioxanivorans]
MADYYPLLVRAISSLPQKTAEGRKAVYDRARTALMRQLRGVDPPLPEGEITRERMGLEEAIRRLEAEFAQQDNASPAVPEADDDEPEDAPAAPPVARRPIAAPPESPLPPPSPATDPARAAPGPSAAPGPATPGPAAPQRSGRGLPLRNREEADEEAASDRRPPMRRGEVRSRGPAGTARRPAHREGGISWQKFTLWTLVALVVVVGIAVAVLNRDALLGGGDTRPSPPAAGGASSDQPKIADRVAPAAGDSARRAPSAPRQSAGGTGRAMLIEESSGSTTPQTFEGTVTWKTETVNAGPGLPPDIALRGDVTIPERQMSMSFVLQRNAEQTLPVSHTIELKFSLPENFPFGGVASLAAVRMRPNPQAQGAPLSGVPVRLNPTTYVLGLSQAAADRQRNVTLLQGFQWLDVLFVYANGKKAALTFEKGPVGEQAFNDAFSAWGELVQRPAAAPAQQNGG